MEGGWRMSIDPSSFHLHNIADTCAAWNVLSSRTLYSRARAAGVVFICTHFVLYECLFKPRKAPDAHDEELRSRFRFAQKESAFAPYHLDIADLQTIELLQNRKRLGKGELSSIAFAIKTRQAFFTDDQKARRLAREVSTEFVTQTTPHLFGWLFFHCHLCDAEKETVIQEHKALGGQLAQYFEEMYMEACRCRLLATKGGITS
jgi:hypothetical protein